MIAPTVTPMGLYVAASVIVAICDRSPHSAPHLGLTPADGQTLARPLNMPRDISCLLQPKTHSEVECSITQYHNQGNARTTTHRKWVMRRMQRLMQVARSRWQTRAAEATTPANFDTCMRLTAGMPLSFPPPGSTSLHVTTWTDSGRCKTRHRRSEACQARDSAGRTPQERQHHRLQEHGRAELREERAHGAVAGAVLRFAQLGLHLLHLLLHPHASVAPHGQGCAPQASCAQVQVPACLAIFKRSRLCRSGLLPTPADFNCRHTLCC